jgi:pantetheine-phosphate adenylyltransferase
MKIVITGGIGSGKSVVAVALAEKLDYKVFSVDEFVRETYSDLNIRRRLIHAFGTSNREELSFIIFEEESGRTRMGEVSARNVLEHIFHDEIIKKIDHLIQNVDDFILEFPLLVEKGAHLISLFDFVITVSAPMSLQLARIAKRDNKTEAHILAIIESQTSDVQRFAISHAIIYNGRAAEFRSGLDQEIDRTIDLIKRKDFKGKKIGIVSGSFDPITLGHTWVIQRALDIVDRVVIAIATNPSKKYLFNGEDRKILVHETLKEVLTPNELKRVIVDFVPSDELTVSYAASIGAKFIFRGLRGFTDLEYENQLNLLQKKIAPEIETIFLLTPRELIEISSSLIKGALALREWERVAAPYVSKCVLEKLKKIEKFIS